MRKPGELIKDIKKFIKKSFNLTGIIPSTKHISESVGVHSANVSKVLKKLRLSGDIDANIPQKNETLKGAWLNCRECYEKDGLDIEVKRPDDTTFYCKIINKGMGIVVKDGNCYSPLKYYKNWRQMEVK